MKIRITLKNTLFIVLVMALFGLAWVWHVLFGMPEVEVKLQKRLTQSEIEALLQPGDLIFQTTRSLQAGPIYKATHSLITHVGLVHRNSEGWRVLEARQPIQDVDLAAFLKSGLEGAVSIKRMNQPWEPKPAFEEIRAHLGTDYDKLFDWSDEVYYCSELVHKAMLKSGLNLGLIRPVAELDFSSAAVQFLLVTRLKLKFGPHKLWQMHKQLQKHVSFKAWMESKDWDPEFFPPRVVEYLKSPILTPVDLYKDQRLQTIYSEYAE